MEARRRRRIAGRGHKPGALAIAFGPVATADAVLDISRELDRADPLIDGSRVVHFPRGWQACKGCGLGVPVRTVFCTFCAWERDARRPERSGGCQQCGKPLEGRISRRFCSDRCSNRWRYLQSKAAADAAALAAGTKATRPGA